MSYKPILAQKIASEIKNLIDAKKVINPNNITAKICADHKDELTDNADFSTYNIHANVRNVVGKMISQKFNDKKNNIDENQLVMEGFEQLQKYYIVNRGKIDLAIPIDEMTTSEVNERAEKLRKIGASYYKHADELELYFKTKKIIA